MATEDQFKNNAAHRQKILNPRLWILLVVLVILGVTMLYLKDTSLFGSAAVNAVLDEPQELPIPAEVDLEAIVAVLEMDSIRAIDDPLFETAREVGAELDPDERVIGLVINGDARAYPISILSVHEVVNDVIGGEPVAVTWCPLCYTALAYSRQIETISEPLVFGISGKLLYNTLVMFDRQTESLWSQLYGAAVDGDLKGQTLAIFPSLHTEWAVWRAQYPNSKVLSKRLTCEQFSCGSYSDNPRGSYAVDPYESYYNTPLEGVTDYQIPRDEAQNGPKRRVIGIRVDNHTKAYPHNVLEQMPLINDIIQDVPVLVWFDPDTSTGAAYNRTVGERTLSFVLDVNKPGLIIDRETGSQWQAITGRAVAGPLKDERLKALPATPAFEFGWFDYFPNSLVFRP